MGGRVREKRSLFMGSGSNPFCFHQCMLLKRENAKCIGILYLVINAKW